MIFIITLQVHRMCVRLLFMCLCVIGSINFRMHESESCISSSTLLALLAKEHLHCTVHVNINRNTSSYLVLFSNLKHSENSLQFLVYNNNRLFKWMWLSHFSAYITHLPLLVHTWNLFGTCTQRTRSSFVFCVCVCLHSNSWLTRALMCTDYVV